MLFNNAGNAINEDNENVSLESASYIMEQVLMEGLTEDELSMFLESYDDVQSALQENVLLEKTIVRLDKKAKLSKAHKMAIFQIAREKKDIKFKKLLNVWRMERMLEADLIKKYGNEGMRRAKKVVANSNKSKSSLIKQAANNVTKALNKDKIKLPASKVKDKIK